MIYACARLMRLPLVLSVVADILLGGLLVFGQTVTIPLLLQLAWLASISACLYLSGMVFNDVFDIEQDRRERPDRPIPSGAVPFPWAVLLGMTLMLGGVVQAWFVGETAFLVAVSLAALILLYDGFKAWAFAPFFMGLCRGANVLLGASLVEPMELSRQMQIVLGCVVVGMTLFILGVTIFARAEAVGVSKRQIAICRTCYLLSFALFLASFLVAQVVEISAGAGTMRSGIGWWILLGTLVVAYRFDRWFRLRVASIMAEDGNLAPLVGRTVGQMLGYYPLIAALVLVTIRPSMWPAAILIAVLRWGIVWGKKYIPIT